MIKSNTSKTCFFIQRYKFYSLYETNFHEVNKESIEKLNRIPFSTISPISLILKSIDTISKNDEGKY